MEVKTSDLILWGGVFIAAYLLYIYVIKPATGVVGGAVTAIGQGVTGAEQGIANLWVSLTSASMGAVLGNVVFPNGAQVPLANMAVKQDASGNVYVNSGGITYQLQPSDANGNWPAVAVGT